MPVLTLKAIHALKPNSEASVDPACPGLIVHVAKHGLRTWVYRYRADGTLRRMRLGLVPAGLMAKPHEMSLAQARAAYYAARGERGKCGDPLARRQEQRRLRLQVALDRKLTVASTVEAYLKAAESRLAVSTLAEYRRQFAKLVLPEIGPSTPLSSLTAERLREAVFAPLERRGLTVGRNRLTATIKAWLRWCEDRYGIESVARRLKIDRKIERARDRVLTESEIAALWRATSDSADRIAQCLRLILLTALRAGEAGALDWHDVESDRFTIPETKNGRAHSLPLSPQARSVIDTQRPDGNANLTGPVFGVRTDVLGQRVRDMLGLSKNDQTKRKRDLQATGKEFRERKPRHVPRLACQPFTPHDLRRTALTTLARLGCPLQVIQKIANHAPSGVTQQVYLRHSFENEAREWLDKLGSYLEGLSAGQVISLDKNRAMKGKVA